MEFSVLLFGLFSLTWFELNSAVVLNGSGNSLKQGAELKASRTSAEDNAEASSIKCKLQGTARLPALSMEGDFIIGGVFSIHHYKHSVKHNYTTMPEASRCRGRLVSNKWALCLCYCVLERNAFFIINLSDNMIAMLQS